MPYPTKEEFAGLLFNTNHRKLLNEHVFGGFPYAYRAAPEDYHALVGHLGSELEVARNSITVVGSGKIGFSLNPDLGQFGAEFHADSDIDVLVASDAIFDRLWLDMLKLSRRAFASLDPRDKNAIHELRRNDIYWGRLWPDKLIRVSQLAKRWVAAFRSVSRNPRLATHEINGRLYRTWDHAEVYHLDGLDQLMLNLRRG